MLTQDRLKQLLDYDAETGIFRWRAGANISHLPRKKASRRVAGEIAGNIFAHSNGDKNKKNRPLGLIGIDYKIYRTHRLAWLYVYGEFPKNKIDHINGDSSDNRIANLRDVSPQINSQNMRKPQPYNSTGLLGAGLDKERNCFKSEIRLPNGKRKFLGRFDTAEEAHQAYLKAKRIYHEGCTI